MIVKDHKLNIPKYSFTLKKLFIAKASLVLAIGLTLCIILSWFPHRVSFLLIQTQNSVRP